MNLKQATDEQLWQALKDAQDLVVNLKTEITSRAEAHYPVLFRAIQDATRKALNSPSMMERSCLPEYAAKCTCKSKCPVHGH